MPMERWWRRQESVSRESTSITRANGAIIHCWFHWPIRANRCTSSTAAEIAPATNMRQSILTEQPFCVGVLGFATSSCEAIPTFTQTAHLDRWDEDDVTFIFGIDAMPNLYERVDELPEKAWKELHRSPRYQVKTEPRCRPENVKQQIVEQREFKDIRLDAEYVAEFTYRPTKCHKDYRVVVVWKDLEVYQGQSKLFDDDRCFFYITNDWDSSAGANRL